MADTRLPLVINDTSKIQLERISHVYFEHHDFEKFANFAADFGLSEAWHDDDTVLYRGYGKDQYCYVARRSQNGEVAFRGSAWVAQTQVDFDKATKLAGAVVNDLSKWPGGGKIVTLKTPCGFEIHVIYGQQDREVLATVPTVQIDHMGLLNGSIKKQRFGEFQRFHPGPALVHKLGHLGYIVGRFEEEFTWYTNNFNFVPSDVQYQPDKEDMDVITFMHIDLGDTYSDHHSLFIARGAPGEHDRMHHTSYEVENFDTQLLGHEWLASKKYESVWGVGRHILGSQIFDYWRDTSGFMIEHYADGDLVNQHTGTDRSAAGPLAVWGPELPKEFREDGTKKPVGP